MVSPPRSAFWCSACSHGSGPHAATPLPPPGAATTTIPIGRRAAASAQAARSATGSAACRRSARRPRSGAVGQHQWHLPKAPWGWPHRGSSPIE